jgi:polyketide cyclase/dehydrase/lipid transport protein
MKRIDGTASSVVAAPPQRCFGLVAAIDRYPSWNGELVREVEVLAWTGDASPARARLAIHVAQSPFGKDHELILDVHTEPARVVHLTRLPADGSDRDQLAISWRIDGERATRLSLDFRATTSMVPSFLPLPGVGNLIAQHLLEIAVRALGAADRPVAPSPRSDESRGRRWCR